MQNAQGYPPAAHARAQEYFYAYCDEDVAEILRKGGVDPAEVDRIILR